MHSQKPKPFRVTKIVFWTALGAAIAAVLIYTYLFYTIEAMGKGNASLQAETKVYEAEQSEVGSFKKDLAANQARQPILVSYFIDANDVVPFLETVEGYGRATGVTVKFDTIDIKHAPNQLAVSITSEGSFENLYRFIALVEAAPYEVSVTSSTVHSAVSVGADKEAAPDGWVAQLSVAVTSITGVSNAPASPKGK